ncbi:hypothetical protein NKR23_g7914 [Pleurostoma richardsiae]|uniref:F-box domain-containing protein n=1 Tax=Pleurostoma richardsiae TaxID=41990 RepID=A0AA38VGA9_9PEZI|nr:hypothetical protein NKR23_g7914 [Pleurostoma richardsiae]
MPGEIKVCIASFLTTEELGALRLTSKHIERQLRHTFTSEFFRKKQFMLTTFSLQTLIDISQHPVFSSELQHLIIGLDHYSTSAWPPAAVGFDEMEADSTLAYMDAKTEQSDLLQTGKGLSMLTEALRNLPNLQTIGIRDFNSPTRTRDGEHYFWRSYGATTVVKELGERLSMTSFSRN